MNRLKRIKRDDFKVVFAEDWEPVYLEGNAMPKFGRSIPDGVRYCIIASGGCEARVPYRCAQLHDPRLVGGIDIWRNAFDDPVAYNKDWYAVLASESDPDVFFIDGPQKDGEHWSDEIPKRYEGAKIVVL